jgi:hypothetical protein
MVLRRGWSGCISTDRITNEPQGESCPAQWVLRPCHTQKMGANNAQRQQQSWWDRRPTM